MLRVALGCACGLIAAAALARGLRGFLYGVAPLDPPTLAAVPLLLAATAALATLLASARIARIAPAEALRTWSDVLFPGAC
jgi:ABC-type lipoprotein release transport system permease subunit